MIELIFIGTSSGKTSLNRFHSSLYFLTTEYNLLIDAGDGISRALLSQQIELNSIDGILITHLHPDHYTGLASLIVQMKMIGREKKLDIYANHNLVEIIENFVLQSYLFAERLGFQLEYHPTYDNNLYKINEKIGFLPRQNTHLESISDLAGYQAFCFSCSSLLIKLGDVNIHYTSDIGCANDLNLFDDHTCNYLISEVTHVKLQDIVKFFKSRNLPEKFILTHINSEDETYIKKYISTLTKNQSEGIILAYDGLKLIL